MQDRHSVLTQSDGRACWCMLVPPARHACPACCLARCAGRVCCRLGHAARFVHCPAPARHLHGTTPHTVPWQCSGVAASCWAGPPGSLRIMIAPRVWQLCSVRLPSPCAALLDALALLVVSSYQGFFCIPFCANDWVLSQCPSWNGCGVLAGLCTVLNHHHCGQPVPAASAAVRLVFARVVQQQHVPSGRRCTPRTICCCPLLA